MPFPSSSGEIYCHSLFKPIEWYQSLYTYVPYNARNMEDTRTSINERVAIAGYTDDYLRSSFDVLSAILNLTKPKVFEACIPVI
jgi:hypothetical protein